ncbi:ABC transporter ATP-binding protein [Aidingimonas halophila]|uniref:NitT/TauT family transport system ATP-binding protein n=1 Tax=Aidingimonas halophila TaxID=574349 RepID=A0A1H2Z966_9GAMM|nr:ABC transporter ATP-binding protein [Aidingimonas halophila]GHC15591.1 aliphatic sulfonates import ATP-binding protein SsuB 2 [Aidingimonas halophila]SDX13950.1 NitT/TauT family transport system ATP-binding protein [Aidingimonas halophila]
MKQLDVDIHAKRFGDHTVLRELRFSAAPGEFIALVGPSGAGKSTLLHLIAGLDNQFTGSIHWNGQPLYQGNQGVERLGMMFQEPRLMPWLSCLDNIRLVQPNRDTDKAVTLLRDVGLGDFLNAWPNQLSGGMQRRLALARAFVVAPQLLLMDEPFVSLDMPTGDRLRDSLQSLWQRHKPLVLFVTHDLREALSLADRILFLSASPGHIILDFKVSLARPRRREDPAVTALQEQLDKRYPSLLSGRLQHE